MKLIVHLSQLAFKQITRHRLRSILTIAGVASGIFLFTSVETLQHALRVATKQGAEDNTLVVYRENRFCPATSRLPEHYISEIRNIPGVQAAIPVQIVVNNCGASLDVIAFRGVPPGDLAQYNPELELLEGSLEDWAARSDGALVGEHFAARRKLQAGDQFEAVGVRVHVAGVVRSPLAQDNNVAYVHLPFLQQASRVGLGTVTQFNVQVKDPTQLHAVAGEIDDLFRTDSDPTQTRPEKAFFAQTARDMIELIQFTRWLGAGAVLAVLGLVANALFLVARGRVQENAILQTLGFPQGAIGLLVLWEGLLLGFMGGLVGSITATLFFFSKRFTLGNEGMTLALTPSMEVTTAALSASLVLGLVAALWPAITAATIPLLESLRTA
ncbi:MAG: ABC transporter permease [Verrucomicrobiota bacterium]